MADKFDFEFRGLTELQQKITDLSKALPHTAIEQIYLKGVRKMARAIRRKTPVGVGTRKPGSLKKAVKAKLLDRVGNNARNAIVAVDRKTAPHAHLVEFGHVLYKGSKKKGGRVIGHVPAHPYFRPGVDETARPVLSETTQALNALIKGAMK